MDSDTNLHFPKTNNPFHDMKLIYRITLRLSLVLLPLMALWATLFYFTMVDEINDETDDALEDYSELIITRMLAGQEFPLLNNGSNNNYSITLVDSKYAALRPHIEYNDVEIFIPEKGETEPARILTTIFQDNDGKYYQLKVTTPTFERSDLFEAITYWIIFLYFLLLITILGLSIWVFQNSMRPLHSLLHWFDCYILGNDNPSVPNNTKISEFRKLSVAIRHAIHRSEQLFEQQKQFIGNASHELQTPLAVLGNRLEWLLDNTGLDENQMNELFKMKQTLGHIARLNKTLLLLTKIDNGQFPQSIEVNMAAMIREQVSLYDEIYDFQNISCTMICPELFAVQMNESLALTMITNLLKNAYVHTPENGSLKISIQEKTLSISNTGNAPLNAERIFDRFYQGTKKEGSTGLGLALVSAICCYYGLHIEYQFEQGEHCFSVRWA